MNTATLDTPLATLPVGHPGEGDVEYRARRAALTALVASIDENETRLPDVAYTAEESRVWRAIMERLVEQHERHACGGWLDGFRRLGLSVSEPPSPGLIATRLREATGFSLVLTDGLLDPHVFLAHLGQRRQPCTVYLRHGSRPDYTPEPDLVHEAIGHAPMLADPDAAALNRLIGQASTAASPRQFEALLRLYWFTLEFGLIEDRAGLRAYGAGLLSSFGELPHAFTEVVDRRPFRIAEVIEQPYHHDRMQDVLFVAPSLAAVLGDVERWLDSNDYASLEGRRRF